MEIIKLNDSNISDFRNLIEIFKDVFESKEQMADNEQLGALLANPNFIVFVARQNNTVVGGLTIYVLHRYYSTKPIAYIYDVGVSPAFQGRGIGKLLMAEVCRYCKENGFEDAYVEAESDDKDAVNFYRKTKYDSEMNAIHFTYHFDDK
ncbi:hypothetical protein CAP35_10345 [Chitinophagaceae bacterium IBVUCB1]|nr:hypothetical protein CAP35_10345 [Chitinophagaceae bacterium IBVUCB1]